MGKFLQNRASLPVRVPGGFQLPLALQEIGRELRLQDIQLPDLAANCRQLGAQHVANVRASLGAIVLKNQELTNFRK